MAQRLLLIEENVRLLNLVGDFLSTLGYEVHRAREADEAEALLRYFQYAAIISGRRLVGDSERNIAASINALDPKPIIVRLVETRLPSHRYVISPDEDLPDLLIEKPVSLLRLEDLLNDAISNN